MSSPTEYASLTLIVVSSVLFTLIYYWKRSIPILSLSIVFWFTSGMMWLYTTSTPGTSLIFWGIGVIMIMYLIIDVVNTLNGSYAEEEEYEEPQASYVI